VSRHFVTRVGLAALAIFLAYNGLLALVRPHATPSSDSGLRNRIVAERYFDGSVPAAVIVGTSIAYRLSPGFLQGNDLGPAMYNLAFGAGSAATGIEILLRKDTQPRVVIVETNLGYHAADPNLLRELVTEPRPTLRRYLPALRAENRPVDLLVTSSWSALRTLTFGRRVPVDAEPDIRDFSDRLAVTLPRNNTISEALRAEIKSGIETTGELVDALVARNVRVVLVQFPVHPSIAASGRHRQVRARMEARFPPDRYEWFAIPDATSYHTDDGVHLTRASGRRLASVLRRVVEEKLAR
jgi:hypothetical protein